MISNNSQYWILFIAYKLYYTAHLRCVTHLYALFSIELYAEKCDATKVK